MPSSPMFAIAAPIITQSALSENRNDTVAPAPAEAFDACLTARPGDACCQVYLARIDQLRATLPPVDWDEVWRSIRSSWRGDWKP